ncbi:MAG: FAD-dependent oxidoreductase [Pedobacter sp.]
MANKCWQCTVCGYVHVGANLPECCPVCGVDKDLFEEKKEESSCLDNRIPRAWRCLVCNYIHEGETPPETCPVCGAGADQFEPVSPEPSNSKSLETSEVIVIVGAGISGLSAAAAARKNAPSAKITILSRETEIPYYRLNLTRYLAGELTAQQLQIHPPQWYEDNRIDLSLGVEVTAIDATRKVLRLRGQEDISYDKLILSVGAHSFIPPVSGAEKDGVKALRTQQDATDILEKAQPNKNCVVIGGGVLGLETAAALARRGVQVTIVEGFDWLLPRQLTRAAGERLAGYVEKLGIRLICGGRVQSLAGGQAVTGVALASGEVIAAELVVFAAGVRCNSALARQANLSVNNGILVDNAMRTSNADIFAVGDVAEHQGVIYGTWVPAQLQGEVAGTNAAGGNDSFTGISRSNILKVLDVDLFSIGQVHPEDGSYQVFEDHGDDRYALFVFRNSFLVGAILMGDTSLSSRVKKLIEQQISCTQLLVGADTGGIIRERLVAGTV